MKKCSGNGETLSLLFEIQSIEMTKKKNLLYDVTCLVGDNTARTGIGNVAINILQQLCKSNRFNIYLMADAGSHAELEQFKETYLAGYNVGLIQRRLSDEISKKLNKLFKKKERAEQRGEWVFYKKYSFKIALWKFIASLFFNEKNNLGNIDIYFSPALRPPEKVVSQDHITKYIILSDCVPIVLKNLYPIMERSNYWFNFLTSYLNADDTYFAISQSTKNDFLKFVPKLSESNIVVTPLACAENFTPQRNKLPQTQKKYALPPDKKYIFSLCTIEPRKNLIRVVETFVKFIQKNDIQDMVFILGGGAAKWTSFPEALKKVLEDAGDYKSKIILVGYIDDEDLAPFYSGAEWFVYTSQYEGFGLPPLEAMACGCPVIVSNNSSLPEVVGDAGVMIDWDSDEQHVEAYENYYFHPEFRQEMARKGKERANQFSWEKCAGMMIQKMLE